MASQRCSAPKIKFLQSIFSKLSKPKILFNLKSKPAKCYFNRLSKQQIFFFLAMNSNSIGLKTYCSLAKELTGIKNSTKWIKLFNFYLTFTTAANTTKSKSFLSQTSLNLSTFKIKTQKYNLKTNKIIKTKKNKNKNLKRQRS